MIEYVEFENYRNLKGKYTFNDKLSIITGKNCAGKTNILDGIRLAFSTLIGDYVRIEKGDFKDSNDNSPIIIRVALRPNSIPSLNYLDASSKTKCGFSVTVRKTTLGKYRKELGLFGGESIDYEVVSEDKYLPNIQTIPLARVEDIFDDGLTTKITDFIESEETFKEAKENSKKAIKQQLQSKIDQFKDLCEKFQHTLDIDITDPKISNEKLFITENEKEHGKKIGSGYKSIANILLTSLSGKFNIILIDEIENHLHPALLRTFLRELRNYENMQIIATTHSPIVVNECQISELLDASGTQLCTLDSDTIKQLNKFLHPGRAEIIFANNVILVEGYTEEMLLNHYLRTDFDNQNWTIVNVASIMFEPYINLAKLLNKTTIVISDDDRKDGDTPSPRFQKLQTICNNNNAILIPVENTLESDLVINGFLDKNNQALKPLSDNSKYHIVKDGYSKTELAQTIIDNNINLSKWHIIKEIKDAIKNH